MLMTGRGAALAVRRCVCWLNVQRCKSSWRPGVKVRGQMDVVVPNQGNIDPNGEPGTGEGTRSSDRVVVVGGEDGRRPLAVREQFVHRRVALVDAETRADDPTVRNGDSCLS